MPPFKQLVARVTSFQTHVPLKVLTSLHERYLCLSPVLLPLPCTRRASDLMTSRFVIKDAERRRLLLDLRSENAVSKQRPGQITQERQLRGPD